MSETKKYIIFGLIVLALLVAGNGMLYVKQDRKCPEITFPSEEVTYEAGTDQTVLMDGVVALDGKDGDVTETLRVAEVLPSDDNQTAMVVYFAKDRSNNVVRRTRKVNYIADAKSADEAEATKKKDEAGKDEKDKKSEEQTASSTSEQGEEQVSSSSTEQLTSTSGSSVTDGMDEDVKEAHKEGAKDNDEAIKLLDNNAPRLYLKQYAVQMGLGQDFDPLHYIGTLKDEKDSESELAKRVTVKGQVNNQETGVYRLEIYVVDVDGNQSNTATLAVFVK